MSTWWCHKIKYVTIVSECACMWEYVKLHDDCHMWNHFNWFSGHFFSHLFSLTRDSIESVNIAHQHWQTARAPSHKYAYFSSVIKFLLPLLLLFPPSGLCVLALCVCACFFVILSEINHFAAQSRLHRRMEIMREAHQVECQVIILILLRMQHFFSVFSFKFCRAFISNCTCGI